MVPAKLNPKHFGRLRCGRVRLLQIAMLTSVAADNLQDGFHLGVDFFIHAITVSICVYIKAAIVV